MINLSILVAFFGPLGPTKRLLEYLSSMHDNKELEQAERGDRTYTTMRRPEKLAGFWLFVPCG